MFWGKTITKHFDFDHKVGFAQLQLKQCVLTPGSTGPVQLFVQVNKHKYLIASLQSGKVESVRLNFSLSTAQKVKFLVQGEGSLDLIGFVQSITKIVEDDEPFFPPKQSVAQMLKESVIELVDEKVAKTKTKKEKTKDKPQAEAAPVAKRSSKVYKDELDWSDNGVEPVVGKKTRK